MTRRKERERGTRKGGGSILSPGIVRVESPQMSPQLNPYESVAEDDDDLFGLGDRRSHFRMICLTMVSFSKSTRRGKKKKEKRRGTKDLD